MLRVIKKSFKISLFLLHFVTLKTLTFEITIIMKDIFEKIEKIWDLLENTLKNLMVATFP